MSSHCNRYPSCGCNSQVGTKCQLPADDPRLQQIEPEREPEKIDWGRIEEMKHAELEKYERQQRGGKSKKPHKKHYYPSNRQPPKKKRKK